MNAAYPPIQNVPEVGAQQAPAMMAQAGISEQSMNPVLSSVRNLAVVAQTMSQAGDPRGAGIKEGVLKIINSMTGTGAQAPAAPMAAPAPAAAPVAAPAPRPAPAPTPVAQQRPPAPAAPVTPQPQAPLRQPQQMQKPKPFGMPQAQQKKQPIFI